MNTIDLFAPADSRLTVLSFGARQDSSALLEMYIDNREFRKRFAPRDFLVIMSDTGDEYQATYEHITNVEVGCKKLGIEFVFLTAAMGYHSESWLSLRHFYRTNSAIGSKAFPKTCTDRLKIQPIYRFLEGWLSDRYGVQSGKKTGFRQFAAIYGKIHMMLGISKGEEKRVLKAKSKTRPRWYSESINNIYPLIDLGMDRQACQDVLHAKGMRVIPSNCKACPYLAFEELEYLRRFCPQHLEDWVNLEAAKLEKFKHKEAVIVTDKQGDPVLDKAGKPKVDNKNYGVFGIEPLPVKIQQTKEKFTTWSDREIRDYRYSHGHCVASAY